MHLGWKYLSQYRSKPQQFLRQQAHYKTHNSKARGDDKRFFLDDLVAKQQAHDDSQCLIYIYVTAVSRRCWVTQRHGRDTFWLQPVSVANGEGLLSNDQRFVVGESRDHRRLCVDVIQAVVVIGAIDEDRFAGLRVVVGGYERAVCLLVVHATSHLRQTTGAFSQSDCYSRKLFSCRYLMRTLQKKSKREKSCRTRQPR